MIAQVLILENDTMAMFDKQDEDDDFNGVDLGSRDTIRDVAAMIDQKLRESRFMMIFINGSDEEGRPCHWLSANFLRFLSPPFLHCHTLRFLGLDHYTDDNTMELDGEGCTTKWPFLKTVQVIDMYYTYWIEILSEDRVELMANLMELNIEGVRGWRWASSYQLQKRLPKLQRLRIINPTYDVAAVETTSSDIDDPFQMDTTSLEMLDLSGTSRLMGRNLAVSISMAIHLRVLILDGCDGLDDVMVSSNFSLRSFSMDGYGPTSSHRASTVEIPPEISRPKRRPADADKRRVLPRPLSSLYEDVDTLDKVFLRGLPNLVELDLSGCAIKVLDFESMVVDVPSLKRLFLIGCEHLCAINWGSDDTKALKLKMVCINTRSGSERVLGYARPPSLDAQQKYCMQLHATITDARLIRSLFTPI
nr:unnamed protein product [Digitaria exilis]